MGQGVQAREEKEKVTESLFKEITINTYANLEKCSSTRSKVSHQI